MHEHRFGRSIASIAAMGALFVAVPWLLMVAARSRFGAVNPLDDIAPPWRWNLADLGDIAAEPLRDDAVVNLLIRSSLAIIWLAIATVAVTIVVEVVHMVRHRGMPSPRVRGLGWAQRIARWVAVGIVALLPLDSFGSTATALEQPLGPAAMAQRLFDPAITTDSGAMPGSSTRVDTALRFRAENATADHVGDNTEDDASRVTPFGSHTVQRGESIYGIAGAYAGTDIGRVDDIADSILDLNLGQVMNDGQRFVNPALIQPGWDLTLPADLGRSFASPAEEGPITHVVVPGESLSEIAEDHLGDRDAWPQLWEHNAGDDMGAGRTFDDPNIILPGWELEVPASEAVSPGVVAPENTEPEAAPSEEADRPEPVGLPDGASADDDREAGDPVIVVAEPPARTPDAETDPSSAPPSSTPAPVVPSTTVPTTVPTAPSATTSTTVPTVAEVGDQAGPTERGESAPQAPSPIRLEHAALLAAGVLTLVGVRRRRALRAALPHARVPTPAPEITATERRLRMIDPGERAARVDIAVRAIAHRIVGTGTQIGTVRIAPDGELIARLTGDARLDAPWVGAQTSGDAARGGERSERTWTLPASVPIEMLSEDARQAGQPSLALVAVGIDTEGRDVLLDLEAAGLTAVEATPQQGDEVVRAIASGLATSLSSEVVHLLVAGLGIDVLFDHPNTRGVERAADTVDVATATVGSTLANDRSAFDLRTRRTGGEMWEPAIILLAHADDAANTLANLPPVGHGVAAVAAVDPHGFDHGANTAGATIRARAAGWELAAFGESIELTPIGLSDDDVAEIAAVLDDASTPIEVAPPVHVDLDDMVADPLDVIPHDIVVTLMGGVSVIDRHNNRGTFERSKTVELIAWLATHRRHATRTAARTALWEIDVRDSTFANVVSEARRALGRLVAPPEGEEWLARTLNESLPLHARVVTDADLIRQRVEHAKVAPPAHAIEVLRLAVEMIDGLPFAGSSYLWPDADGLTSNLVLLATTATAELAAHALSVGDTELVFWATGQGLKVLPGHEELIGLRMRAHARSGDLAGVRQEWESYERVITADSWSDGEPAPKLLDLRRELLSPSN